MNSTALVFLKRHRRDHQLVRLLSITVVMAFGIYNGLQCELFQQDELDLDEADIGKIFNILFI